MASTYKVLGQSNPAATTSTTAYTVPALTQAVVSSIVICNRSATPTSFRVNIDPGGGGDANEQYLCYDAPIGANETIALVVGVTLGAADLVRVYATLATLSFNVFGEEIT